MMPERNETTFLETEETNGNTTLDNKQSGAMDNKKCGAMDNPQAHNMDAVNNTKAQIMDISKDTVHTEVKYNDSDKSSNDFKVMPKKSGNENINGLEPSGDGLQGVLAALQEAMELIETLNSQIISREDVNWADQQSINHKQSINHDQKLQLNRLHSNILQAIKNIKSLLATNQERNTNLQAETADVGVQTVQFFGIKEENGVVEESIKTENLCLSLDPNHILDFNEEYSLLLEPQLKGSDYLSDVQPLKDQPPSENEQPLEEQYHSDLDYKPGLSPSIYGVNEIVPPKKRLRKKKKLWDGDEKTGCGDVKRLVSRRPKRKMALDCDTCGETFTQERMLLSHMIKQHNVGQIKCDKCSKLFTSVRKLQIHKRRHDRYHCHLCNRDLSCRKNFENHQLVAHSTAETKQECELCNKKVSVSYMERHIRRVHDKVKPHQCDECGKGFCKVDQMREHKLSHSGERPFKCDLCDKAYSMKAHLWTHKANHHRGEGEDSRVMCGHCGKLFRFSGLKKHESLCSENPDREGRINEDGTKTFGMKEAKKCMCQKCGKWFSSALSLKNHEVIHTGEKKIKCDICGEGFRHYNALYAHKDSHNPGTEYPCEICGKAFKHKENLRIHTYRHIKPRTFPCDVCGKTFNEKGNLKRHMNIHTGEKSYRCDQCGRNFAQPEGLKIHSVVHTGEKPYKCDDCGKAFTQCGGLSGHRKRCHMKISL